MTTFTSEYRWRGERDFADYLIGRKLDFIHQPARFALENTYYTPDFYVPSEQMFYEVAATRQAYSQSRPKLRQFRRLYPILRLRVVNPDGTPYNGQPIRKTVKESRYPVLPIRRVESDLVSQPYGGIFIGNDKIIRLRDIAQLLNSEQSQTRRWVIIGKIPGGFRQGRHLFVDRKDFFAWYKKNEK